MKNKIVFVTFILAATSIVFGWGDKGHKIITLLAMRQLPAEMKLFDQFKSKIVTHSVDADYRKKDDYSESPKHFIDIDYYKEFLDGKMITFFDTLTSIYGEKNVIKEGILPWATEQAFYKLIEAFKSNNRSDIILYMSDLAHYVGDGHQPQHATINYNGQLIDQKGIHFRYEIDMLDRYQNEINDKCEAGKLEHVKQLRGYIFDYITEANNYLETILLPINLLRVKLPASLTGNIIVFSGSKQNM
jgi:hypothetical protein